jgi:hypothetical protein
MHAGERVCTMTQPLRTFGLKSGYSNPVAVATGLETALPAVGAPTAKIPGEQSLEAESEKPKPSPACASGATSWPSAI